MIVDLLANSQLYDVLSPRIRRAFEYLHQTDLAALELGNHEIDGKNIYVRVQQYATRPQEQGVWEAHRRYIDLQVIVEGAERICYAPLSRLTPGAYDEAKDFWRLSGEGDSVTLPSGSFMLLWPTDGHMPCLAVPGTAGHAMDTPVLVKKVVVKIAVE
ncbi:MAG: YhcH/YjgK/YiaL family protein [Chloroflexi bacterium]|nr:YhcH/YjgK/YiaL family protein [Chloroflexota bacterium]